MKQSSSMPLKRHLQHYSIPFFPLAPRFRTFFARLSFSFLFYLFGLLPVQKFILLGFTHVNNSLATVTIRHLGVPQA